MAKRKQKRYYKKKNKQEKIKYFLLGVMSCLVVLFGTDKILKLNIFPPLEELYAMLNLPVEYTLDEEELAVHFIDVGQGDSVLIQGQGSNVLIDAGKIGRAHV